MKKILLFLAALVIFVLFIAQIDDELSGDTKTLLSKMVSTGTSPAYLYLLGINAHENDRPETVGAMLFAEYRKEESDDSYVVKVFSQTRNISLPEGELFCSSWQDGCMEKLFNSEDAVEVLLEKHAVLLSRLDTFYAFEEYETLTKPLVSERFPPYQYIIKAQRIKVLNAIHSYQNGQYDAAISDLQNQLRQLRHALALQDTLIGKMIFLMKLSEVVDVLAIIGHESNTVLRKIASLSLEEKTFSAVAAREFVMAYHMYKGFEGGRDIFATKDSVPAWVSRFFYKPNMSINVTAPIYSRLERLSLLSPAAFAKDLKDNPAVKPSTSRLRNYVGSVLTAIAGPNLDEYVARFMDVEAKLALYNKLDKGVESATNPYYKDEGPEIYTNKVCFKGPLDDDRFLRCLRLKI